MATPKPGKYASKLLDSNTLILGGTSGIGFAVAEAAWEFGAKVTISGSNQPKIDFKMAEMTSNNPAGISSNLRGYPCDLASQENLEENLKALSDFATHNGQTTLDHIVFCAGDRPKFRALVDLDVPYIQAASLVRGVAPILIGKLGINTAKPRKGWSAFAGVGGAVEVTVRGLAVDLAPIRVNGVAPGAVHTELFDKVGGDNVEGMLDMYREKSLTKTVGKPEEVAEA